MLGEERPRPYNDLWHPMPSGRVDGDAKIGEIMATDDRGSVTHWLSDLRDGDRDAARPLWDRYFERLVSLARARLKVARSGPGADEEDAALSAFYNFCEGAVHGR